MDSASDECSPARPARKRVRTISNLTDEQIRKKRAADREAQRAVRERTKSRIQNLEQQLATLQPPEQDDHTKELQELRRENQYLKDRLRRVHEFTASSGSEWLGGEVAAVAVDGLNSEEQPATKQGTNLSASNNVENENNIDPNLFEAGTAQILAVQQDSTSHEGHRDSQSFIHQDRPGAEESLHDAGGGHELRDHDHTNGNYTQSLPGEASYLIGPTEVNLVRHEELSTAFSETTQEPVEHPSIGRLRRISPDQFAPVANQAHIEHSSSGSARTIKWASERRDVQDSDSTGTQQLWPTAYESTTSDEYLDGVVTSTHGLQRSPEAISPCWVEPQANCLSKYTILPKHLAATCPLDQILLDFLSSRRQLAAQGTPTSALVGPLKPAVSGLLDPRFKTRAHASSRVIVDIVSTFTDTDLTEKLGFLCIMYATMRWQIAGDQASYENLPSWLHPTVLQVVVPHAAWIDNIPWPRVRDVLIQNPNKYTFRDFSEMYARNARLNWPYKAIEAVIPVDGTGEVSLNPLFEKHALDLECWSVEEPFAERFPELAAEIRS